MVKVGVEQDEAFARFPVEETHPGDHAAVAVSPGGGCDDAGRVAQPEVVVLQWLQTCAPVEDSHELPPAPALASESDPFKLGQIGGEVLDLSIHAFLCADDVGGHFAQALSHGGPARRPGVGRTVAGVAKIVSHDCQRSRSGRRCSGLAGVAADRVDRAGRREFEAFVAPDLRALRVKAAFTQEGHHLPVDRTPVLQPGMRVMHDQVFPHAGETRGGNRDLAVVGAFVPAGEPRIEGTVAGDDPQLDRRIPGTDRLRIRVCVRAQPNAIDPRGGPKDPVRFQLIDDHGSLIRWRDHDDPTEIGGPSRRIGEKTAQQDAAHRVGDHVNAGRLAEPLPLQQLREPGAGQVLQGKRAGRIRSIDHPVAGALE